jgi:hypothetical protein
MYDLDDEVGLHLLPDDQQHAGLLRLLSERERLTQEAMLEGPRSQAARRAAGSVSPILREASREIVARVLGVFDCGTRANERCSREISHYSRHSSMSEETSAVQPVWCEAPSPAPESPWKYS